MQVVRNPSKTMNTQFSELKSLAIHLRDAAGKIDSALAAISHLETMGVSFNANGVTLPAANGRSPVQPVRRLIIGAEHGIPKSSGKTTMHDAAYSILAEQDMPMPLEALAEAVGKKMGGRQVGADSLRSVLSRTKDSTDKRIYAPAGEGKWGLAQWKSDGADLFTSNKKI